MRPRRALAGKVIVSALLVLVLAGCNTCRYKDKTVTEDDARAMKDLGMKVRCD